MTSDRHYEIISNRKMSCSDRVLFVWLEVEYPLLCEGKRITIEIWKVAYGVGCSKRTVSRFLLAMKEGGYFSYVVKKQSSLVAGHMVWDAECIIAELAGCKEARWIDTRTVPSRQKERKKSKKRSKHGIVECDRCGSLDLVSYGAKYCKACDHVIWPHIEGGVNAIPV